MAADARPQPEGAAQAPRPTRLSDYRPPAFLVDTVDLGFALDPAATRVTSRLTLRRNPAAPPDGVLSLDGEALTLKRLVIDGVEAGPNRYALDGKHLTIADLPDTCTLEIETSIAPEANTELSGLYVSGGAFFTQCEAEGFRRITFFPDRPDVMARFTTTVIGDQARFPVLLSNGNPVASGALDGGRHFVRWEDPHPKPSYLFALVAGDLVAVRDHFTTRSGRDVQLAIYVRRGDQHSCGHAMQSLKTSMRWDEDVFGLEYDLDVFNIAAVSDFNMGAMENKGLNVFNTKYVLARPETATDSDYQGIEAVIAHEYFHNWTGNRVTCRDWFQLSLKEGLTVFRDQEFSADQGSRAVKRIADVRALRAAQFREDAGPLAHPVQPDEYVAIDNFYTATIYSKGAEVIRMLRTLIGGEAFRRGFDLYIARHDNQAVTIDDFVQAMQDASGVDLGPFKRWYHQAGTPELTVAEAYDPSARRYVLTLSQTTQATPRQPEKRPVVIPVAMALLDEAGAELPTRLDGETTAHTGTRLLVLTEASQSFTFVDVPCHPLPSLPRGFSAPVKLTGMTQAQLRPLAAQDTDPFVRWDSGAQYATHHLLRMAEAWQRGETLAVDPGLIESRAAILRDWRDDPAFAAEALSLPSESALGDQMAVMDPDAVHVARDLVRVAIAEALHDPLQATYAALTDHGPYRLDATAIGGRALRNVCLGFLLAPASPAAIARARAQFDAGQNMTDVLAALACLAGIDCPDRVAALAAFHAAWRGEALVLDKWFAIQAGSALPDTLQTVIGLTGHADFDPRNPNRVRALVGAFAANQLRFHDKGGAGYGFLADMIIRLDAMNGQLAARTVSPLGQWRRVDAGRQALMRAALQRIQDTPALSEGTTEMVTRSLG